MLLAFYGGEAWGYSSGAPSRACEPLVPFHPNVLAQTGASPYNLEVTTTEYTPGTKIAGLLLLLL